MRLFLILLLLPIKMFSQNIEGVWTGTIYNDTTKKYIPYEIAISENKGKYSGYSHTTFTGENNKQEAGVKSLKIKKRNNKIIIEDNELIYNNYAEPPAKGVKQYSELNVMQSDSGLLLIGVFNTNRTKEYSSVTGTIRLQKIVNIERTKLIAKLEEMKLAGALSFNQTKKENVIAANTNIAVAEPMLIAIKEDTIIYKADVVEREDFASFEKTKKQETPKEKLNVVKATPAITKPAYTEPKKQIVSVPEAVKQIAAASNKQVKTNSLKEDKKPEIILQQKEKVFATTVPNTKIVSPAIKNKKPEDNFLPKEKNKEQAIVQNPKAQPVLSPVISFDKLSGRQIETIKTVEFKSDSLTLTLYDNGVVDGDTVTIILNGKIIMPKQGLSTKAITKTLYITPEFGDSLQLIMYAENLGSIAPNTGLLIIQDGEERYEIRFSGDLQKNSAIILRRRSH